MPDRKKTLKEFDRIVSVLVDALILLQDQPDVVFCKDCRWFEDGICEKYGFQHPQDWFCADGEQK